MLNILRSTSADIIRTGIFCFVRVPAALATVAVVMVTFVLGGGDPAEGVARSFVTLAKAYQATPDPDVLSERLFYCTPPVPAADSAKRPLLVPAEHCHSETHLVGVHVLEASIRRLVTRSYFVACMLGLTILGFERLYERVQAYLSRRKGITRPRHACEAELS
jgi:hypothetical protein